MPNIKKCKLDKETIADIRKDRRRFLRIISSLAAAACITPSVITLSLSEAYSIGPSTFPGQGWGVGGVPSQQTGNHP